MRRAMGRVSAGGFLLSALWLTACPWGYGPAVDRSGFVSAKLSDDGRTAVFSYQRLVYRPAEGLRAFPDGGVPRYVEDEHWVGSVDIETGVSRVFSKVRNRDFSAGQGAHHVQQVVGSTALLGRGGRLRDDGGREHHLDLLDAESGDIEETGLAEKLAENGRAAGYTYLVREDGLLVLVTPSLREKEEHLHWPRTDSVTPEIWLRTPEGSLRRIAASHHYEGFRKGGVFFWSRGDRLHRRYDVDTGEIRVVPDPRFRVPDVRLGVGLSSDRRSLELSTKTDSGWRREPLPVSQVP